MDSASILASDPQATRTMKKAEGTKLNNAVFTWFLQARSLGEQISEPLLCAKALDFNKKLNGSPEFNASTDWVMNFKSRHGIIQLPVPLPTLAGFKRNFKTFVAKKGYEEESVYCAFETGLFWTSLPRNAWTRQPRDKRVTIMPCSNVSGSHMLPLLLIGESENLVFKDVSKPPVSYKYHRNARMDLIIFHEWYTTVFITEVRKYQEALGVKRKVLLILNNAPSHPCRDILNKEDENFKVVILPTNIASILQPMEQGIIDGFKRLYKREFLESLRQIAEDEDDKVLNLLDCSYMCANAWEAVPRCVLNEAWRQLWPQRTTYITPLSSLFSVMQVYQFIGEIGCGNSNLLDADEWLSSVVGDVGYQVLTDDEILQQTEGEDEEEPDVTVKEDETTHDEAFSAFETGLKWLESQEECDLTKVLLVRGLRDLAARKMSGSFKRRKIN